MHMQAFSLGLYKELFNNIMFNLYAIYLPSMFMYIIKKHHKPIKLAYLH